MMSVSQQHQGFIDWMKAVGMILIVIGHVVGAKDALFNSVSAPVYSKQLGVAFFVFVAGWGLGNCHRERRKEAFNRLFPIFFYGAVCAVLMSGLTWIAKHDLAESNYMPLAFGVNVFFNFFPANPTTWYIGMYLHLILLWWWLAPTRISIGWVVPVVVIEILIRAYFLSIDRPFTGYMMVTNWLGVFVLGYALCTTRQITRASEDRFKGIATLGILVVGWLLALFLWREYTGSLGFDGSFPTRRNAGTGFSVLWISAMVTVVYAANTLVAFAVFRHLNTPWLIGFVARNTLLIFILHMPLIYRLAPKISPLFDTVWQGKLVLIVLVFVILGLLSELINRLLPISRLRDFTWRILRLEPSQK